MASVNIQLSEFSDLCRLCGAKTSVLMGLHIFDREGDLRQIYKKITACLPIQVNNNDKLPKMVCEECVYKLDALFEFREKSMKTEYALNNMLKSLYSTTCSETLGIQMETLICTQPLHTDSIHPHTSPNVEVDVHMESNGDHLDTIMGIPLNDNSSIKCEPELVLIKNDNSLSKDLLPDDSEGDDRTTLTAVDSAHDSCSMNEQIENNIEISEMRNVQAQELKTNGDIEEGRNFLVAAQTEHQETWYFCNICGKPFENSSEFQEHCEIHWKKCNICGISCSNDDSLLAHMQTAHSQSAVLEPQIEADDKSKPAPKKEVKGDAKTCHECGKEYRTNYKLAQHMRKHTGEKPFKCSMCEKTFRSKIGLAQHEGKHTGHYDYTCNTCGKGFQCKSYLIVHQRVHSDLRPYPCETCGRNFKTKHSLLDHQNRHLGLKPYLCEICGRGFITKGLCKSHQRVHSGTDNRQFPCSVCNKLFVSKSYLVTHMRIHTGEKPFMCEVCGKGFLTRVDLKIHSTMHTGEKSFVCEICGKAFARRDALRCHKRSHTGERPYKCDICGQGFTQFSPMAIHKRLHTGERPYSCDICSKTFVSRSTMMSHRKKHAS
ncbi:zinc finger protein 260-like [Cimex lectularius]|uniref:Zinc finger protein n=1 Tax=Cimex lectularius TaxID=79782 RepID=A0A8I6S277_CIMLE|nr:zinc finger protein 260-like [Cimex lectularius]